MIHNLETALTGVSALGGLVLGSQVAKSTAGIIAQTTQSPLPEWMSWLIGPAGALVGLILALRWMVKRLEKAELKYDLRESERDLDRKQMIELIADNNVSRREQSDTMRAVQQAVSECAAAVRGCPGKK